MTTTLTHIRTENGAPTLVTTRAALDEINHVTTGGRSSTKTVTAQGRGATLRARIEYKDGRTVTIEAAPEAQPAPEAAPSGHATRPKVQEAVVNGKSYIIGLIQPAIPRTPGATMWRPLAYVSYWGTRDGERFGPTRTANQESKPGTIGAAIWAAASR